MPKDPAKQTHRRLVGRPVNRLSKAAADSRLYRPLAPNSCVLEGRRILPRDRLASRTPLTNNARITRMTGEKSIDLQLQDHAEDLVFALGTSENGNGFRLTIDIVVTFS